jgi:hypothetical protein
MNSSDWWANEKECRDSEGNRLRSSVKFKGGEPGPGGIIIDDDLVRVMDPDRGPMEALREDDSEEGSVGGGRIGCWRIRRRPEAPIPCSCSVMTEDLIKILRQPCLTLYCTFKGTRDKGEPRDMSN